MFEQIGFFNAFSVTYSSKTAARRKLEFSPLIDVIMDHKIVLV